jgi:hypothetical protein
VRCYRDSNAIISVSHSNASAIILVSYSDLSAITSVSYNNVSTGLGFKRSMLESLSNIYYRMHYCNAIVSNAHYL